MNLEKIKNYVLDKVRNNLAEFGDNTPTSVYEGAYRFANIADWRLGFWGGILHYCYLFSDDKVFLEGYEGQRPKLLTRLYEMPETLDHDMGFVYLPTEYARYKLSGDEESLQAVRAAADALALRYQEKGRFIRAWDWDDGSDFAANNDKRLIIDCMFNLPLLFEAYRLFGDERYYEIACAHANTCAETIVREDGTTFHTYLIDPVTGERLKGETRQGLADDSCWSRGQAWAMGGFAMAYRYTKDAKMLETAVKTADVFVDSLEETLLPAWDFALKGTGAVYDTSAAAIACCALLELCDYVEAEKRAVYRLWAERMFEALWNIGAKEGMLNSPAIITHSTGFFSMDSEIDTGIIYGDYYFVKALAKFLGMEWFV